LLICERKVLTLPRRQRAAGRRPTVGSCVGWIDCGPCVLGSRVLVGPDGRL